LLVYTTNWASSFNEVIWLDRRYIWVEMTGTRVQGVDSSYGWIDDGLDLTGVGDSRAFKM
jgi:hypothetical protein